MTTQIKFNYDKPGILRTAEKEYEKPIFVKEEPVIVLEKLFGHYHVCTYKSLELRFYDVVSLPAEKGNIRGTRIHGIEITELNEDLGLQTKNSINNIDILTSIIPTKNFKSYDGFMNNLIEKYLIDIKITSNGFHTKGSFPLDMEVKPSTVNANGTQEIINYFDIRKETKDIEKEKRLEEIIEYGKVAIANKFNMKTVEKMTKKIAEKIPTEFDSEFGSAQFMKKALFLGE
jgi:hypothetical protein